MRALSYSADFLVSGHMSVLRGTGLSAGAPGTWTCFFYRGKTWVPTCLALGHGSFQSDSEWGAREDHHYPDQ